jgi:hypothetical protein
LRAAPQVVLPDKYKPDSDVVMWMEDAAADKEEAQQRAAVVALARVASNLPLQRLLSTSYKDRFVQEEGRERERQERAKAYTMRTLRLGRPSMCISITSPRTTGPTFSGVPE